MFGQGGIGSKLSRQVDDQGVDQVWCILFDVVELSDQILWLLFAVG